MLIAIMIFFCMDIQFFQHHLLKIIILSPLNFSGSFSKVNWRYTYRHKGLFLNFLFCSIDLYVSLYACHTALISVALLSVLKLRGASPPTFGGRWCFRGYKRCVDSLTRSIRAQKRGGVWLCVGVGDETHHGSWRLRSRWWEHPGGR